MIKWIGQHIWDFISRFRNDVYLESVADGTVHEDKFLGLDSTGKIVKETVSTGAASTVTVTDSTSNTVFPVVFHNEATAASLLDDTGSFVYNPSNQTLNLTSSTSEVPNFALTNTNADANGAAIVFQKIPTGSAANNDVAGKIVYTALNNADQAVQTTGITSQIVDITDGSEAGKYNILVTANGSTIQPGLQLTGSGSANEVSATIGYGATSTTTVAGGLVVTQGRSVNVASGSQKPIGMQIARRTITSGEADAMHSAPIELIPAQGANTIIEISNVIARADRASAQLNSALTMDVHYEDKEPGTYGSASLAHFRRYGYGETTDFIERRVISQATSGLTLTEDVDKAVEISFSAAATGGCFTSIDIYVTYFVIDIS